MNVLGNPSWHPSASSQIILQITRNQCLPQWDQRKLEKNKKEKQPLFSPSPLHFTDILRTPYGNFFLLGRSIFTTMLTMGKYLLHVDVCFADDLFRVCESLQSACVVRLVRERSKQIIVHAAPTELLIVPKHPPDKGLSVT